MIAIWVILFLHLFTSLSPYQITKFQGLVRQTDQWDCGPAAAGSILSLTREAIKPWPAERAGRRASLAELSRYLQNHGWEVEAYFLQWSDLQHFLCNSPGRPLIVHLNRQEGHYMVLLGLTEGWLVVADPTQGVRAISPRLFQEEFSGYVLYFPSLPAMPAVNELVLRVEQRLQLLQQALF